MTAQIPVYRRGVIVFALIDDDLFEEYRQYRWHFNSSPGHAVRRPRDPSVSPAMHRQICGLKRGDPRAIHHINEDGLDNRRENLLVCASMSEASSQPHPKALRASFERQMAR